MLRVLDAVDALTPPDAPRRRHGPKRLPEKGSLVVGHFLRIDGSILRDTYMATDRFKAAFGTYDPTTFKIQGDTQRRLFGLAFKLDHPALREALRDGKGVLSSILTDGEAASISRWRKPGTTRRDDRKAYLEQEMLRDYSPWDILGVGARAQP